MTVRYYLNAGSFEFQRLWCLIGMLPLLPWGSGWTNNSPITSAGKQFERIIVILLIATALLMILE